MFLKLTLKEDGLPIFINFKQVLGFREYFDGGGGCTVMTKGEDFIVSEELSKICELIAPKPREGIFTEAK